MSGIAQKIFLLTCNRHCNLAGGGENIWTWGRGDVGTCGRGDVGEKGLRGLLRY